MITQIFYKMISKLFIKQIIYIPHIQISLRAKFQVKLTILIFWTESAQKGHFRSKIDKVNTTI